MTTGRLLAAGLVLLAVVTAVPVWVLGGPRLAGLLADDVPAYAVAIWWVCLAPLALGLALLASARTPWPWVVVVALHLAVVVAATTRLRHLLPGALWLGVGLSVLVGVTSVVATLTAAAAPPRRPAVATAPAPGGPTYRPRD